MSKHIKYKDGYKYVLAEEYTDQIPVYPEISIYSQFITLTEAGILTIRAGYAWDGASGPTIDTASSMRGALIHDALYQLMREELLQRSWRQKADEVLRDTCIADGMFRWRAWVWYKTVRKLAGFAVSTKDKVLVAP